LVRGKVTKFKLEAAALQAQPATVEIVHVYRGSQELIGITFTDHYIAVGIGGYSGVPNEYVVKSFEAGEEGIWSLTKVKSELITNTDYRLSFARRARKVDHPRYSQIVTLAEAVEKYTKAKPDEQSKLAEELVQDPAREIGYWIIHTLGDSEAKADRDLLVKWRKKPDLPLSAQIALDEVSCNREREVWFFSPERATMLKGGVSGKADEFHVKRLIGRLDVAMQTDQLRGDKAIELLQIAVLNKEWRKEDRLYSIRSINNIAHRIVDHQAAYDWLFDQMKSNPDIDVRRTAAGAVGSLSLYPKRTKLVEEYSATAKDPEVVKALQEAFNRAKVMDKK
jgi:hypothetical protein